MSAGCLGSSNYHGSWLAVNIVPSITLLTQVLISIMLNPKVKRTAYWKIKAQSSNYCTFKRYWHRPVFAQAVWICSPSLLQWDSASPLSGQRLSLKYLYFFLQINRSFTVLPNSGRGGGGALKEQLEISNPFSLTKHWFCSLSAQERICFKNWRLKTRPKETL